MGLFGGLLKTAVPAAIGYATGGPMGALKGAGMSLVAGGLGGGDRIPCSGGLATPPTGILA